MVHISREMHKQCFTTRRKTCVSYYVLFPDRSHHKKCLPQQSCQPVVVERLSARHLILQHALGRCIFVRHAPLSVTLYCASRSLFVRHALLSVTLFYACAKGWQGRDTRVHFVARWMDGGGERVHARPNAWAFARALDGRRGYGETSPSTSARAIDCARHMYAHSAYT